MKHKTYKAGIYVRLSKEDSREEESLSVENQKVLLVKHVQDNGWELIEIYCDDGFSGVNQERPALQKMLQDVKEGNINTILIKEAVFVNEKIQQMGFKTYSTTSTPDLIKSAV